MSERRLRASYVVRITSEDIGQRVSVRHHLGEDAEGPSYSDTLGHLESWADGVLRIRRRDGSVVEVLEQRLVAGRTVPPPPEPRRRRPPP